MIDLEISVHGALTTTTMSSLLLDRELDRGMGAKKRPRSP